MQTAEPIKPNCRTGPFGNNKLIVGLDVMAVDYRKWSSCLPNRNDDHYDYNPEIDCGDEKYKAVFQSNIKQ